MSRPATYTPEERRARRLEQIRASVARHAERLAEMTRLEQAAWKSRASLGEGFDPYTAEERAEAERLNARLAEIRRDAERLNKRLAERLTGAVREDPRLAPLLAEIATGGASRLTLPPF